MKSRTKRDLGGDALQAIAREAFGAGARVRSSRELTEGMFNAAYRLDLEEGPPVVLKVAPPPGAPLLTYEAELMRTEAWVYHRLAGAAPMPQLLHAGFSRTVMDGDYLLLSWLAGTPWNLAPAMDADARRLLRRALGGHVAAIHAVDGPAFGYPQPACGLVADTWASAFTAMVAAVVADAERFAVVLPVPAEALMRLVRRSNGLLDEVRRPALVHFDLWDGNIFVSTDDGPPRIEGLIDAERAFFGDPVADLVCLALRHDIETDEAFLEGYRQAGGDLHFTPSVRRRLDLYRIYLCLIVIVEAAPRGYDESDAMRRHCAGQIVQAMGRLAGD